jgi:hypothetical protein
MRFRCVPSRPQFDVVTAVELPVKSKCELPVIPVEERAAEVRAIKTA